MEEKIIHHETLILRCKNLSYNVSGWRTVRYYLSQLNYWEEVLLDSLPSDTELLAQIRASKASVLQLLAKKITRFQDQILIESLLSLLREELKKNSSPELEIIFEKLEKKLELFLK